MSNKNHGRPDFKELLLRSGLPLEADVTALFRTCTDAIVYSEHEFESPKEDGKRITRSVDAKVYWSTPTVNLDVLVECKYKKPGVQWLFLPGVPILNGKREFLTLCLVPPFLPPWYGNTGQSDLELDFRYAPATGGTYPVATHGVQVIASEKDDDGEARHSASEPIRNALFQLRGAAIANQYHFKRVPKDQLVDYFHSGLVRYTLPILVTTAELWIFRENVGVDAVTKANGASDVAQRVDALIHHALSLRLLRQQKFEFLKETVQRLTSGHEDADRRVAQIFERHGEDSSRADIHCMHAANRVLIVHASALAQVVHEMQLMFSSPKGLRISPVPDDPTYIKWDVEEHFRRYRKTS